MRTIEAPGVEIKEIDKSGYAPAMTGTRCFVMGYSDKGTPYEPMEFTSKTAWQNYYGDPDNEAERYFYNACAEVINQNGVLYCSRLPYDNIALDKMVAYKYKVGTQVKELVSSKDYCAKVEIDKTKQDNISHNPNFERDNIKYLIANDCVRQVNLSSEEGDGVENDTELQEAYTRILEEFNRQLAASEAEVHDITSVISAGTRQYSVCWYALSGFNWDTDIDPERPGKDLPADRKAELSNNFLYKRFVTEDEAKAYAKSFTDQNKEGDVFYVTRVNALSTAELTGDWEVTVAKYVFERQAIWDTNKDGKYDDEMSEAEANALKTSYIDALTSKTVTSSKSKEVFNIVYKFSESGKDPSSYSKFDTFISYTGVNYEWVNNTSLYQIHRTAVFGELLDKEGLWDNLLEVYKLQDKEGKYRNFYDIITYNRDKMQIQVRRNRGLLDNINNDTDAYKEFLKNATISLKTLVETYGYPFEKLHEETKWHHVKDADVNLDKYLEIDYTKTPYLESLDKVDEYRTGEDKVPANSFLIVDKTCATLNSISEDSRKGANRQMIGIFPVVTTAANALYAQNLLEDVMEKEVPDYESVNDTITHTADDPRVVDQYGKMITEGFKFKSSDIVREFSNKVNVEEGLSATGSLYDTVSLEANQYFSTIQMNTEGSGFDTENLKKVGVVVYKAYLDAAEGNLVSFTPVEAFIGSLDPDAKNPNTGTSLFIDKIVNTQSEYIYFFSNCFTAKTAKKQYNEDVDMLIIKPGTAGMLGFYSAETAEEISIPGLYQGIEKCFTKVENLDERDIDIVCDAGLANIGQYLKSVYDGDKKPHAYDIGVTDDEGNPLVKKWTCKSASDVSVWKTIEFKFDNFCKNVRKDCMFIADGPRPLVLQGEKKIVRTSKPSNTIDANILPYVKWCTGLNTNYGAGYCDWFQIADEFTGDEFWCPPSIKAMGVYINTDVNYNYWDAPAGLNRGVIAALDTAFSPTIKQAGSIYTKNWNYAINYPYDGIVLEGQKTFQVKPSAFDRVNVRRLFLRLERQTRKVARYFVYEGITQYNMQRFVDTVDTYFKQAKNGGGIYDYKIVCDATNNTPDTIDNNELHAAFLIKPVKTAEFIMLDFYCLRTGADWSEAGL